ncbi:MAG: hypothetical protein AB8D52_12235 [Gammaproteobacteria bacterium]
MNKNFKDGLLKKASVIVLLLSTAMFQTTSYAEEDQDDLIEKLEEQGISIGRLSDDPHASREDITLSEAEILLWETDQLSNIDKAGVVRYEFERKGQLGDGFTDSVELNITKIKEDGMKAAAVTFFSGDRNQSVAPNENTNGNPVLGVYLQGDVYEMNRLTEGSWRYFHKRIKFALADDAVIEPVKISVDGKEVNAKKVTFKPYVNDPRRKMFEEYADKIYEVTVSEDIPGMLYKIRTIIPATPTEGEASDSSPKVEETLLYAGVDFE